MEERKMLYISPFWPVKSGISEYSETLIWGLDNFFKITLFVNDYHLENKQITEHFDILYYKEVKNEMIHLEEYDVLLYNFGNNPDAHDFMYDLFLKYPGYVIFHDISLYYLTIDHYRRKGILFQKIYELEGVNGIYQLKESLKKNPEPDLLLHKELAAELLLSKEIIERAKGIFVHSYYAENQIRMIKSDANLCKIHLVECNMDKNKLKKDFLHQYFGIKSNERLLGAVGFIAPSKQNRLSCLAVQEYNQTHKEKIHYVMIGEGNEVDNLLGHYIHKTGFLQNKDFYNAIASCDAIFNLRYPYNGESSATLIQCMGLGKPCLVTDIGWFRELDEKCVIKVSPNVKAEALSEKIEQLIEKEAELKEYCYNYVKKNCSPYEIAFQISDFII